MITIEMFRQDPSEYIWMSDEKLIYDSGFEKKFNGNFQLLLDCCSDNTETNYDGDGRTINYPYAIADYFKWEGKNE